MFFASRGTTAFHYLFTHPTGPYRHYLRYRNSDGSIDLQISRWSQHLIGAGHSIQGWGGDPEDNDGVNHSWTQEITRAEIEQDLDALFDKPWPDANDPLLGFPGGYPQAPGGRYLSTTKVSSLFDDDGGHYFQGGAGNGRAGGFAPSCAFAENLQVPLGGNGLCATRPLSGIQMIYSKVRAQVLGEPGQRYCLYDLAMREHPDPSCGTMDNSIKLNCRSVNAGTDGILDIPLPPLGHATYLDEFCDCENLAP